MKHFLLFMVLVALIILRAEAQVSTRQNGLPITINNWQPGVITATMFQTADTFQISISEKLVSYAFQLVIKYAAKKDSIWEIRCNAEDLALYQSRLRSLKPGDTILLDKAKGIDRDGKNVVIKTSSYYLTD